MYILSRTSRATGLVSILGAFSTPEKARAFQHQCENLNRLNHYTYETKRVTIDPLG